MKSRNYLTKQLRHLGYNFLKDLFSASWNLKLFNGGFMVSWALTSQIEALLAQQMFGTSPDCKCSHRWPKASGIFAFCLLNVCNGSLLGIKLNERNTRAHRGPFISALKLQIKHHTFKHFSGNGNVQELHSHLFFLWERKKWVTPRIVDTLHRPINKKKVLVPKIQLLIWKVFSVLIIKMPHNFFLSAVVCEIQFNWC